MKNKGFTPIELLATIIIIIIIILLITSFINGGVVYE